MPKELEDCVKAVTAKGKSLADAYAICNAMLKKKHKKSKSKSKSKEKRRG
jgi:hypothetical protein